MPDEERFPLKYFYQCSHWRANAYVGGPNLLTSEDIYQKMNVPSCPIYHYVQFTDSVFGRAHPS
jgi:hypothetical protein